MRRLVLFLCLGCLWTAQLLCQTTSAGSGLDPDRLDLITQRMQDFVEQERTAGVVTLVSRHGVIAHHEAVGRQDIENDRPMRKDTIFQIMSMTKPVTALGIMLLQEDGKLAVWDRVDQHLPEFADLKVRPAVPRGPAVELEQPVRLFHLLTHTSGMSGPTGDVEDLYSKLDLSLAEGVRAFARQPLNFQPGSQWQYSNTGVDTLGRIIEVVSGRSYEEFLRERIFDPLGMEDTFFFPPEDKKDRIAMVYRRGEEGGLEFDEDAIGGNPRDYRAGAKYPIPAGGLYSTAGDLAKFYQMMLDGGEYEGGRVLSPATIDTMTTNHTGDLEAGFGPGIGLGLGWQVVRNHMGTLQLLSEGSYGHGGAFGTQGWIDPERDLFFVLLVQRRNFGNSDQSDLRHAVQTIALSAVLD